jgi:MinD-like ATPase involved in chromosome partitioning or flagellar assembly
VTVFAFASLKGSPGVTTLTCLVAAKWPSAPAPIVVECDPAGGDLAARFELSSRGGWTSLAAALRREGSRATVDDHLQRLPGGLEVLIGTESTAATDHAAVSHVLDAAKEPGGRDLVVDMGRLPVREDVANRWIGESEEFVLVSKADPPSLINVRLRTASLRERFGQKLGLVVVGPRRRSDEEIEAFTGMRLLARVPWDSAAAAAASGERGGGRRLSRSRLVASAARLASELAEASSAPVRRSGAEFHSLSRSAR